MAKRECGSCTACCDGFRGEGCCTIYERRPQEPCRTFVCGWLLPASPFPESFRPDRLGVMMVPTRWRGRRAYILRSAGRDPDEQLLTWMRGFSVESGSPFFYESRGERFGFGPPEFQHEMLVKLESGERLW